MIDKLKELFRKMNEHGLYAPMFRDHGKPSVSLTLLILSSIFVILGIISFAIPKWDIQINGWQALAWFVTNAVIYHNRGAKISKDGFEITSNKSDIKSDVQE